MYVHIKLRVFTYIKYKVCFNENSLFDVFRDVHYKMLTSHVMLSYKLYVNVYVGI